MDQQASLENRPANGPVRFDTQALTGIIWGVRGSVPDPGPHSVRYGGNTSCVEVRAGGERLILDAGTGIRALGETLKQDPEQDEAVILLTHFHWDHIQGLPFFSPAYKDGYRVRVMGPGENEGEVRRLLRGQMRAPYFPVEAEDLQAEFRYGEVGEGRWNLGGIRIHALQVRHPSLTLGYRLEAGGHSLVFIPDNELGGEASEMPEGWADRVLEFLHGADVLIHDAMFTEAERPGFEGWGHSTYEQVVELAVQAEVDRVFFFHHAPGRSDEEIDGILARLREEVLTSGSRLQLEAAAEGMTIVAGPTRGLPREDGFRRDGVET